MSATPQTRGSRQTAQDRAVRHLQNQVKILMSDVCDLQRILYELRAEAALSHGASLGVSQQLAVVRGQLTELRALEQQDQREILKLTPAQSERQFARFFLRPWRLRLSWLLRGK